ncbi:hypothetical protein NCS52_00446200 [Fusarium sp. LHS14.1]|nr:hypothetical protein NCS52_00446200 [Fusarium sp. LHS14.1]
MVNASHLEFYLLSETPSDYFYSLAGNNAPKATKYAELLSDHALKSDNDLRGLIKAGYRYKPTLEQLDIDLESNGPASVECHPSSSNSDRSSRKTISLKAHGLASSELYPSLKGKHGRGGQDASLVSWDARPRLPQLDESPLLTAIREVLSSDPSYAEDVVCSVNQIPYDKRSLSLKSEPEPADDPGSPKSPAGSSKKQPKLSAKDSNGGGRAGRGTGRGRSRQGAGDRDDKESQDGSERGGRPRSTREVNMEKRRRWVCPYALAYPHLRHIPMFRHCWPGNMTEVYLWRDHLGKHHSPIDSNANPPLQADVAQFHMNPNQWEEVYNEIENGRKKRPRDKDEWFSKWKNLFLKVWHIIFPQNQFPHLNEPSSPFHPKNDEIAELHCQAKELLKSVRNVRADRAVESKAVASREDFRPSDAELDEMMSEAMSIAMLSTPVAFDATYRLAHASSQIPPTTSADHTDAVGAHPETALQEVPSETPAYTPTTAPSTSGPSPIDLNTAQTTSPVSFTTFVTLFPHGTQVTMNFLPTSWYLQTDAQMGQLQLSLPTSFYTMNFNQAPLPIPPAMATPNIPVNLTLPTMGLDPGINQHPPIGPPGSQDVFMQEIQGGAFGAEESAVVNNLRGQ